MNFQSKTLFLDRDGVINRRPVGDYVRSPQSFFFEQKALEALAILAKKFSRIIVVTNQQGIGKGLFSEADLARVHAFLSEKAAKKGGRIDAIFHCPHLAVEKCACRKPATGMAEKAKIQFPEIDFSESCMVGDSASDLLFGQRMGMKTALIEGKSEESEFFESMKMDGRFASLFDFANWID